MGRDGGGAAAAAASLSLSHLLQTNHAVRTETTPEIAKRVVRRARANFSRRMAS